MHIELPETLTGVEGAHRRGAGRPVPDDPRAQGAGGLRLPGAARSCRGRLRSGARSARCGPRRATTAAAASRISKILGCRGVAVLPEGMSRERFDWLGNWVSAPEDIVRTPGTESNVKEIYDACAELARDPANEIVNQFSEFGNYARALALHRAGAGKRLPARCAKISRPAGLRASSRPAARRARWRAGDYLKDKHGTQDRRGRGRGVPDAAR